MKRNKQIDAKMLLQIQFERDFMKKEGSDIIECQKQMSLVPKFHIIGEVTRDEKTYDSRFWNLNYLKSEYGINLEIAGRDKPLLDAFQKRFKHECFDRKRVYFWYQSPDETTHDFGRLNAGLIQIHTLEHLFVTAMTLILNVHDGIMCPLTADDDQARNLDIGYWYNNVARVLVPQNICLENLKPVNGQRINFHIHTEPARYYKPLRNFIVEKKF